MKNLDAPTDKQIGMLHFVVKGEFEECLTPQRDERGAEMKFAALTDWVPDHLDKYQVSGLINILRDDDLSPEMRSTFLVDYLKAKGYDGV